MIPRSDFESITESASSLDYNPRARLQGGIFAGGGDPYLRVSKDTGEDMIRDGGESRGPRYSEDPDAALREMVDDWKRHAEKFKSSAGFRKASRGQVDPRRFALHLSRIALKHAKQYGSRSLLRMSKRLHWAASQSRKAAEEVLRDMSNDDPDDAEPVGVSHIVKPGEAPAVPQWGTPRAVPQVAPDADQVQPGSMREQVPDRSWSSEKTGSRRRADENNSDLIQYALDFLEDYRSTNSLAEDSELMDELNQSEVFESWLVDLDSRGVLADPQDLDEAWNQALSEMTNGSPDPGEDLSSNITMSRKFEVDPDDPRMPGPTAPAPGGDPFNSVLDTNTHPGFDRYIKKKMSKRSSKYRANWAGRFMEDDHQSSMDHYLRRAGSKSKEEDTIIKIANQFLDGAAGALTPDQISKEDVEQFIGEEYPDTDHEKVYAVIAEITDPKKRHEKDKKERTNEEYRASRPVKTTRKHPSRAVTCHYVSSFDTMETGSHRKHGHLQGHREICACCTGTGQEGAGACSRCQGSGRHGLDPDDPQVAAKARVIERVGSLLLVEIKPQKLSPKGRQALSQVTRTRVASGTRVRYTHSPELMQFLTGYDVPFKMVGYRHPNY